MTPYKKAVATIIYKQRGEEKKRYQQMGTLFKRDDGSLTMKLESLPLGEGWNGFINFYDFDEDRRPQGQNRESRGSASSQSETTNISADDDIPF